MDDSTASGAAAAHIQAPHKADPTDAGKRAAGHLQLFHSAQANHFMYLEFTVHHSGLLQKLAPH